MTSTSKIIVPAKSITSSSNTTSCIADINHTHGIQQKMFFSPIYLSKLIYSGLIIGNSQSPKAAYIQNMHLSTENIKMEKDYYKISIGLENTPYHKIYSLKLDSYPENRILIINLEIISYLYKLLPLKRLSPERYLVQLPNDIKWKELASKRIHLEINTENDTKCILFVYLPAASVYKL